MPDVVIDQPLTVLEASRIARRMIAGEWPTKEEATVVISTIIEIVTDGQPMTFNANPPANKDAQDALAAQVVAAFAAHPDLAQSFTAATGADPAKLGWQDIVTLVIQYGPTVAAIIKQLFAKK